MKRWVLLFIFSSTIQCFAQEDPELTEAKRILSYLASDELKGRSTYSPEIEKAADFIAAEFSKAGLMPWDDSSLYRQEFVSWEGSRYKIQAEFDGLRPDPRSIIVLAALEEIEVNEGSGLGIWRIPDSLDKKYFFHEATRLISLKQDMIVVVPPPLHDQFNLLYKILDSYRESPHLVIFVKLDRQPERFSVKFRQDLQRRALTNVIGLIPGRSLAKEYVIFSAHYDHVGVRKTGGGDVIFNGANDNASGVTALVLLARHFAALKNNERSLLFIAFSGEELGLVGSSMFVNTFPIQSIVSVINIEMIGDGSRGKKKATAYITGSEKSDLIGILNTGLEDQSFRFVSDPYPAEKLFERSDNYSFSKKGVVAHTIMSTRLKSYAHYHQVSDEVRHIDFKNIVAVTRAIAGSSAGIVAGKVTPVLRRGKR